MSAVLVVRPSSLGDIVYALAVVADILQARAGSTVDWVVEPGFAALAALCPDVRRSIPFNLRHWRREPGSLATWRALRDSVRELRRTRYDAVLDLQEQMKGALITRLARGRRHGFDRASIREPLATLGDDVHHRVPRDLHFVTRCRLLAGAALGYPVEGTPRWNLRPPVEVPSIPARPYVVILHSTSRAEKLWPEADWRALVLHCERAGYASVVPWGSAEDKARSHRLAQGHDAATVPPWLTVPEAAALLSRAALVVGVDTGFTHLAAALRAPTLALFTATDRLRHGVACAGAHARDLGDAGSPPSRDDVLAAADQLLRMAPG
jgi:heptosyltransferase-1